MKHVLSLIAHSLKTLVKPTLLIFWYVMLPIILSFVFFDKFILDLFIENKWLIGVVLAAIFNAVMDSIENEHIGDTIFAKYDKNFWSKRHSWNTAPVLFRYKIDAWHLSKSAMIIAFACCASYFNSIAQLYVKGINIANLLIIGYVYIIVFNGFYNYIFKKKNA